MVSKYSRMCPRDLIMTFIRGQYYWKSSMNDLLSLADHGLSNENQCFEYLLYQAHGKIFLEVSYIAFCFQ